MNEDKYFRSSQYSTIFLSTVSGNLIIEEYTIIKAKDGDTVFVSGEIRIKNGAFFECNLKTEKLISESGDIEISGYLHVNDSIVIKRGNLKVNGSLTTNIIDVNGSLTVKKNFSAFSVNINGSLNVDGDMKVIEANINGKITIFGSTEAKIIITHDSVEFLGNVNIGTVNAEKNVKIRDGIIKELAIKGNLEVINKLIFDKLDVNQIAILGSATGGIINIGNKLIVNNNLTFDSMDIKGACIINGDCEGGNINISDSFNVKGNLKISGMLNVNGHVEVNGKIISNFINVNNGIKAESVIANEKINASGVIIVKKIMKASVIKLNKLCKIIGLIIGDEVIIGEKCELQDIYGGYVELGRESKARNIYARDIRLEEKCIITGDMFFTNNLVIESNVKILGKYNKVNELPKFTTENLPFKTEIDQ
ncbi:MAG: hypothetical protein ACP5GU_04475 [Thermoprotei archaeon]